MPHFTVVLPIPTPLAELEAFFQDYKVTVVRWMKIYGSHLPVEIKLEHKSKS